MRRARAARSSTTHGYSVLEAPDGAEALDARGRARRPDPPPPHRRRDAGDERPRARRALARRARPSCKRPLHVGLHDDAIVRHGVLDEGDAFLQKPFTPDTLRKVRELLDRSAPRPDA